jgi:hypothetical protein
MTWDQLYNTLLMLYQQRILEWQAVKDLMANENIDIDFGFPTDLELEELAAACGFDYEDDEDEDNLQPF